MLDLRDPNFRLFVSSTFRDLQAEREVLSQQTFPSLREELARRGVTFTEVDLRWGVTAEDATEGRVLQICLEEIDRCRPYFIGILGSRYGSTMDPGPEALAQFPWLHDEVGHSITELEFVHGALRIPQDVQRVAFYVRADAEQTADPALRRLVERVRSSGACVRAGWRHPEDLARMVARDLRQFAERDFAERSTDEMVAVAAQHDHFASTHAAAYSPSADDLDVLREASSTGPPLVVTGDAGSGKTALLASFAMEARADHDLFHHYPRAAASGGDPVALLRRLLAWLRRDTDDEMAPSDLRHAFESAVFRIPEDRRAVILIDCVDLLDDVPEARRLVWLPRQLPPHVRLIVSARDPNAVAAAKRRGWTCHRLAPLDDVQRRRITEAYLSPYGKRLDGEQMSTLIAGESTGNLLFLQTLLNDLRLFGTFEELNSQLAALFDHRTVVGLLGHVLSRVASSGEDGDTEAEEILDLLWASRAGLSEQELVELVSRGDPSATQLLWLTIRRALRDHLVSYGARHQVASQALREAIAVHRRIDQRRERAVRRRLVAWLLTKPAAHRIEEVPFQLEALDDRKGLAEFLLDLENFRASPTVGGQHKLELQRQWQPLQGAFDPVTGYFERVAEAELSMTPVEQIGLLNALGLFFGLINRHDGAAQAFEQALEVATERLDEAAPELATFINNVGHARLKQNHLDQARVFFDRALRHCRSASEVDRELEGTILDNIAQCLTAVDDRLAQFESAYRTRCDQLGDRDPATLRSLHNYATAVKDTGDVAEALRLARQVVDLREDILGPEHLETAISRGFLANSLVELGRWDEAEEQLALAIPIYEKQRGPAHPHTLNLLNLRAVSLLRRGRGAEAKPLLQRLIAVQLETDGRKTPDGVTLVHNLGVAEHLCGNDAQAHSLVERAMADFAALRGREHPQVLVFSIRRADILAARGDVAEAELAYREAMAQCLRVLGGDHPVTSRALHGLGVVLSRTGRPSEAASFLGEAFRIRRSRLGAAHDDTVASRAALDEAKARPDG